MDGVQPSEQPPNRSRVLPIEQKPVELAQRDERVVEEVRDVFEARETRDGRPEKPPPVLIRMAKS